MRYYLAGPFFNPLERENITKAIKILKDRNLDLFIPMDHKIEDGENLPNQVWGQKVFEMDRDAIYDCDAVIALYYGLYSDSGTAFEIGFAHSLNKPIIVVHCNNTYESSLMIVNSATANLENIDSLKNYDFNTLTSTNFISHKPQK